MVSHEFEIPDEYELIEFFGDEPVERVVDDGYWCYEVAGSQGTSLRFSLNVHERSVQTELRVGSVSVATISHEMATRLSLDGNDLRCEFVCADCRTILTIDSTKGYKHVWSTLRTK